MKGSEAKPLVTKSTVISGDLLGKKLSVEGYITSLALPMIGAGGRQFTFYSTNPRLSIAIDPLLRGRRPIWTSLSNVCTVIVAANIY